MVDDGELTGWAAPAERLSQRLAWLTDRAAAVLLVLLVLDVWLGVVVRYLVRLDLTFMEEAARYLMIWVALLAVSSCVPRREHIGVQFVFEKLPAAARRVLLGLLVGGAAEVVKSQLAQSDHLDATDARQAPVRMLAVDSVEERIELVIGRALRDG